MNSQQKESFNQGIKRMISLILILTAAAIIVMQIPLKNDLNCDDVDYIKIAYLPKGINTAMAISDCNDIFQYKEVLREKTFYQSPELCELVKSINNLEKSREEIDFDFRIKLLIFTKKTEKPLELCLGEGYLTTLNGRLMMDNPWLFKLLDEMLFN